MARKNLIKLDFDSPTSVLGIASNEKIWKLCWGINQELNLNLSSAEERLAEVEGNVNYTDFESSSDFDFFLIENNFPGKKVSKLAKKFRYWLVIRQVREEQPELPELLTQLARVEAISLALDLSEEKDIKKLLP